MIALQDFLVKVLEIVKSVQSNIVKIVLMIVILAQIAQVIELCLLTVKYKNVCVILLVMKHLT